MCELSGEVIIDNTLVKIRYAIINKAIVFFKDLLIQWNDKVKVDQTYFRKAYKDLKRVNKMGIQNS